MGLNLCDRCSADCRHHRDPNEIVVKCGAFKPPMTNADRIRAMSDEELAKAINLLAEGESVIQHRRHLPECDEDLERDTVIPLDRREKCALHWLQQPVKEDTTC